MGLLLRNDIKTWVYNWRTRKLNILILYGPNQDDITSNKDNFWEDITEAVEGSDGTIMLLGERKSRSKVVVESL